MKITHTKVSGVPDGSDPAQVQPSDWNADHAVVQRYNPADWTGHVFAADDDFMTGTLDTAGSRASGATPWTQTILTDSALSFDGPGLLRLYSQRLSGNDTRALITQPVPAGNWKYRTAGRFLPSVTTYGGGGLRLDSPTKRRWFTVQGSGGTPALQVQDRTTSETWVSGLQSNGAPWSGFRNSWTDVLFLEIERSGGDLIYRYSSTGHEGTFVDFYTENSGSTGFPVADITTIGLINVATDNPKAKGISLFNWFRRIT